VSGNGDARWQEYVAHDWYWIVGGDETRVYASARQAFVPAGDAVYSAWLDDGHLPTRIASMADLEDVLRAANVPPYHRVAKSTIVRRLQEAGKLAEASAALNADLYARERWYAPDRPAVNADDPEALALLQAIGADPAVILAREADND
jgi:hypothetical protein